MFGYGKENNELLGLSIGLMLGMIIGVTIGLFSKNTYRIIIIFSCLGGLLGIFFIKLKGCKIEN
ncbi:MAG: hypothetical protein K0R54_3247 [Clostridiaceae bacterium]|nr:hypothetical protein [Clostridiaceae bacterium]